jgi:hypothetical protein
MQMPTPPVADLHRRAEPLVPIEAAQPGKAGEEANTAWNDKVLIWGRTGWAQVGRLCQWAVDMNMPGVTKDVCMPKP